MQLLFLLPFLSNLSFYFVSSEFQANLAYIVSRCALFGLFAWVLIDAFLIPKLIRRYNEQPTS